MTNIYKSNTAHIRCRINGKEIETEVSSDLTLSKFLREHLNLTGTKEGCLKGECGACTVIMNGRAVTSCLVSAFSIDGANITTIEGLGKDGQLHPLQEKFIEMGAVQCGFCIPGMILSAKVLLDTDPNPTREKIKESLAGNLCRCTGYERIFQAVEEAAKVLRKKKRVKSK